MKKEIVVAAEPGRPYSPAVRAGNLLFLAGIGPDRPGDVADQTRQVMDKMKAVLEKAGSSLDAVVNVNAYLDTMENWSQFNSAYKDYFPSDPPARTTVSVRDFPEGMIVEIACIAIVGE
jgi:2-iminobutanoate/2-iminopropanoate deaminase